MDELLIMFLVYGGGFALALGFMVLATFRRARLSTLATFVALALFCLLAQGGCWHVAAGFGRATNGGGDRNWHHAISSSFIICAVWTGVLFISRTRWRSTGTRPTKPSKPETFDY